MEENQVRVRAKNIWEWISRHIEWKLSVTDITSVAIFGSIVGITAWLQKIPWSFELMVLVVSTFGVMAISRDIRSGRQLRTKGWALVLLLTSQIVLFLYLLFIATKGTEIAQNQRGVIAGGNHKQIATLEKDLVERDRRLEQQAQQHAQEIQEKDKSIANLTEALNVKNNTERMVKESKAELLKKVDSAPTHTEFSPENARAWMTSARTLVKLIVPNRHHEFMVPPSDPVSLEDFQESVESLRAIAVTLAAKDLGY